MYIFSYFERYVIIISCLVDALFVPILGDVWT